MGRKKLSYDEKIFEEFKKFTPDVTDSTIKTYVFNLWGIAKYFEEELEPSIFLEFDIIKEYLTTQEYSLNTIKNKVSAIISYLKMKKQDKDIIEKYKDYFDVLDGRLMRNQKKMEKSTKEKDNWLSKDGLMTQIEYLKNQLPEVINNYSDLLKWMKYIILLIYYSYPLRNDLSKALIIDKADKINNNDNYIIIDKKNKTAKLLIQAYKTRKVYKSKELNILPNITSEIIKYENLLNEYKKTNNINNDLFLFDKKGNSFSTNDFTIFFKSIFSNLNKDITSTMIRKIIVSSLYDVKAIKELSNIMGHSANTQLQFYAKE